MTDDRKTVSEAGISCFSVNGPNALEEKADSSAPFSREALHAAIRRTVDFFREAQKPDGHWVAELEGDALLQSETVLLLAFLGQEDSELAKNCAARLLATALADGGWEKYPGAGADVTNSVKGYFALKLTGHDPASDLMRKTRKVVLSLGGAEKVNSFTRFYLALLGQIPYDQTPAVPPQMIFLPAWFPLNIYAMSSWSRTIFVPLSIVSALQPVRRIPPERGIRELMTGEAKRWPPLVSPGRKNSRNPFSWDRFFRLVDRAVWGFRKIGITPFRSAAINRAKKWTIDHFRQSNGPGAIQPPIVWSWVAFKALGLADDSPEIERCRREFEALVIDDSDPSKTRVAPCKSPVWDTSLVLKALRLAGVVPSDPMIQNGEKWLLDRQTREPGDWRNNIAAEPGGWAFEYQNEFYPDNDDTAMALMVLDGRFDEGTENAKEIFAAEKAEGKESTENDNRDALKADAVRRGTAWLAAMQNKDGGWAAFDKGNTREILCRVPFADHNAMIDPSSPDLTGRVLESFGRRGFTLTENHPFLTRCESYLKKEQRADGSWFGRWGVNYLYGTWQALTGLTAIGVPINDETIRAGANWLLTAENPEGGWGESPDSYADERLKGRGPRTASQTAWAIMGLLAAGNAHHPAVRRGIRFLLESQLENGRWNEPEFTGTGFPQVFYLRYHYYSVYFPLMALSIYAAHTAGRAELMKKAEISIPERGGETSVESSTEKEKSETATDLVNVTEEPAAPETGTKKRRRMILPFPTRKSFRSKSRKKQKETIPFPSVHPTADRKENFILKFDAGKSMASRGESERTADTFQKQRKQKHPHSPSGRAVTPFALFAPDTEPEITPFPGTIRFKPVPPNAQKYPSREKIQRENDETPNILGGILYCSAGEEGAEDDVPFTLRIFAG